MRRIVYSVSSFLSCLAIVGCNFKGNTDMQKEGKINCQKWDAFAAKVGVPGCDQAVPATDKAELVKNLIEMPKHFAPDGSNYAEVTKLVQNYVSQIGAKTQATEIVSVKKLADVLVEAGFDDQLAEVTKPEFISIPYYERDKVAPSDLSAYKTLSGINKKSKFKIYSTKEGKIDTKEFAEGTAYVLTYKLNGSEQKYSSIVTIPDTDKIDEKFKLIMYAHGGDAGLSLPNMARVLQNNLGKGVVAAPSFPGEPICSITTIGGSVENNFIRSCGDAKGNVIKPAVAAEGEKSPLDNDVNSFLGLHNAIGRLGHGTIDVSALKEDDEFKDLIIKHLAYNFKPSDPSSMAQIILKGLFGPETIGVSDSRGGATLLAAVGRTGIMLSNVMSNAQGSINIADLPMLALFNSAGLFYTPSTLLIGGFRIVTQNMLSGNIYDTSTLNQLPMIPDLKKNSYFTNYRLKPVGQDQKELNELVGWIGASDIVFLAPYISVGMQNWNILVNNLQNSIGIVLNNLKSKDKLSFNNEDNSLKFLIKFIKDLTSPNLNSKEKSLFNYFADSLNIDLKKKNASVGEKCNINNIVLDRCSIYNIFLNGEESTNTDGIIAKENIPKLVEFFNNLGDKDTGLISLEKEKSDKISILLNVLNKFLELNISTEKMDKFLTLMIISVKSVLNNSEANIKLSTDDLNIVKSNIAGGSLYNFVLNKDKIKKQMLSFKSIIKDEFLSVIKTAPGSLIFLHSTQDGIVPYTQSLIAKRAMDMVFDSVYGSTQILNNPLTSFNIPAVGSQLFAFQPEDRFYAVNLGEKTSDGGVCSIKDYEGKTASNYNPEVNKCFGKMALNKSGDGLVAHGDSAVRSARLISAPLQGLSYNDTDKVSIKNSLLYGNQNSKNNASAVNINTQLETFNTAYNFANKIPITNIFYPTDCTEPKTGIRYLLNACPITATNFPLFNRTLFQDGLQKDSIVEGRWEQKNKTSSLTPTDIFTLWMESAAVETSKAN